jgi:prepilin-type N-terminal cleavage/methylation domain-containing protein
MAAAIPICRPCSQGFTLMELMITMSILLGILAMVVGIMIYGVRMFNHASLRQGLEGDARRLSTRLKQDVALTDFRTVSIQQRSLGAFRRDGLCMASLSNWDDDTNFQTGLGLPRWNRYTVYYATLETSGRLMRQDLEPSGVPVDGWSGPYGALSTNLREDPALNPAAVSSTVLSGHVQSFECETDLSENTVAVRCRLRQVGLQKAGSNQKSDESLEFRLLLKTKNTWPDI